MSDFIVDFKYNEKRYQVHKSAILNRYNHLIPKYGVESDYIVEFLYGGRDSAKSYTTAQLLILECLVMKGFRCALIREQSGDVKDSQWQLIKDIVEEWGMDDLFDFRKAPLEIECKMNNNKFIARGCNEPQNLKSITACNRAWIEEGVNEEESMTIILGTIRSSKSKVKVYYTFNPECQGDYHKWWIFKEWFFEYWSAKNLSFDGLKTMEVKVGGKKKEISLKYRVTHSTYHDNPYVTDERIALHESRKGHYYTVYTLGLFGYYKTGGEFLPSFNPDKHVQVFEWNRSLPFHISVDSNTAPYVAISGFQVDEEQKELKQAWEYPCRSPHASGTRAARKLSNYLQSIGYDGVIILYGDATANNKSTVDENNKSFFDKFREELRADGWIIDDRIGKSNPRVGLSGDFFNDVLDEQPSAQGWKWIVNKTCVESIEDYTMCKKDMNNGIVKKIVREKETGIAYQERGHLLDIAKYFLCEILSRQFEMFGNRRKKGRLKVGLGRREDIALSEHIKQGGEIL
jgi:phage terminase large subunit